MVYEVTEKALVARINRKLAHEGERLCKTRGERWLNDLGEYHAVDIHTNGLTAQHVDPVKWGRDMGVLRPDERVVESKS
jgi:hypothetical protein